MVFTRVLGPAGPVVSAVGLGCWAIGGPDVNLGMPMGWGPVTDAVALDALERGYELGATLLDTADVYGHGRSERLIGKLVAQVPRESVVLSSKVGYFAGTAPHGYHPGHMRRQLEQTLDNLGTDHLDIYFFHHNDFGPDDRWLHDALAVMRQAREEGLVRAVGMRGPHRFAPDRLRAGPRHNKVDRFRDLFHRIRPQVLAVRDNLLSPPLRAEEIVAFAADHSCGVLVNKPLAQGLLAGADRPDVQRIFDTGDHRSRKRWFTPPARAVIQAGLDELRAVVGPDPADLVRVALWSCLMRGEHVAVLAGFTNADQVSMNLTCLLQRPDEATVVAARDIMARVRTALDAGGQVFTDETEST